MGELRSPGMHGAGMNIPRRSFLHLAAGAAALSGLPRVARGQTYPTRPVRIIVGYPAGAATDLVGRLMGQWLSAQLGQQFIIENRAGANSNIGTEVVTRAAADGYALLMVTSSNSINTTLYDKLNFNFNNDIVPVAGVVRTPLVMVVNSSVPAKTVPEFIAYAKAHPGEISMAAPGIGSPQHVTGELFKLMAGVSIVSVPYRGGAPAFADLLGGQVQVYFPALIGAIEYIRTGKLRALAVTSAIRSEVLPDIPTMSEFVPGYEASFWLGLGAPKNTPTETINKLNKEINAALADPKIKARLADLGGTVLPGSPADFGKLIADETEKWGKVIRAANIKPE
jgi:tripartite-type tricarboxylate transporter receptor subunit TctC